MEIRCRPVLAVDDARLRDDLAGTLSRAGYVPLVLGDTSVLFNELFQYDSNDDGSVLILETGTDAAALCQVTYEMHRARTAPGVPKIIAIIAADVLDSNPRLGFWTIDGRAALIALVPHTPDDVARIPLLISRLLCSGTG